MNDARYWFPAKRYGWGWGLPSTWQGWVVLVTYLAAVLAGLWLVPPETSPQLYALYFSAVSCVLLVVCWLKGEPPRWRWGQ